MRVDEVRGFFESVDAEPSAEFTESLLVGLQAEYLRATLPTIEEKPTTSDSDQPVPVELVDERPHSRRGSRPERPKRRSSPRRIAVTAAAAVVAGLIVTGVLVRTAKHDGIEVITPPRPDAVSTTNPTPSRPPLPDGLKGLPPAGATPSTPETGQLLATLPPIPIWVYEDGRVISARWTTHDDWTGFLEQRLTPEGVELVRADVLALAPLERVADDLGHLHDCRYGLGNYLYTDGARTVCESPGATSLYRDGRGSQYLRLSELQYGAPSWLPTSAWLDPEPKPYLPSTYQIMINTTTDAVQPPPIDVFAMLATLPPEAAELLTVPTQCPAGPGSSPNTMLCFKVTTEKARQFGTAVGITEPFVNDNNGDSGTPMGVFGSYWINFHPYLPHEAPVWCCGG